MPLPDALATTDRSAKDAAERRRVTVMFSDLVGSTALSARMDPEDLREIISAYQKCIAETVRRFAGFVAKYMGDGVLVYFGYPEAYEDDPERAVRAALELVAAVTAKHALLCKLVSVLPPVGSLSVISSDQGRRKNAALSARRRTLRRDCRELLNGIWGLSPTARENCLVPQRSGPQSFDFFQYLPKSGLWSEAHSSIPIHEGEPTNSMT